jgi:hypothetical protein
LRRAIERTGWSYPVVQRERDLLFLHSKNALLQRKERSPRIGKIEHSAP